MHHRVRSGHLREALVIAAICIPVPTHSQPTPTPPRYHVRIVGVTWDLSNKTSVSLDYQEQIPVKGISIAPVKPYFAHFVANF
ncbi:MAG: hypothetical protein ABIR58_04105 [Gemmatimonadaceae bacterium]